MPMSRCAKVAVERHVPATSFLNMAARCASLVPAAKSTEGEPEKRCWGQFFQKFQDTPNRNPCTIQVSDQLNEEGRVEAAPTPWQNTTAMPAPLSHVYILRLCSKKRPVQVTKPLMTVETQLENEARNAKTATRPQQRRWLLFHLWLYRYSSWKRLSWCRRARQLFVTDLWSIICASSLFTAWTLLCNSVSQQLLQTDNPLRGGRIDS